MLTDSEKLIRRVYLNELVKARDRGSQHRGQDRRPGAASSADHHIRVRVIGILRPLGHLVTVIRWQMASLRDRATKDYTKR